MSRHAPIIAAVEAAKQATRDRSLLARMSANIASGVVGAGTPTASNPTHYAAIASACVGIAQAILDEIDSRSAK